jgi:PhoH-like ATPase
MIVDEAQNLTPHEVKTVVSRAGEGTKVILTGDPYQIDSPYLDSSSNGLTYAVERLKTQKIHGHMTLKKSERSMLAGIAADLL